MGLEVMPFVAVLKEAFAAKGPAALASASDFDQAAVLTFNLPYITATLEVPCITAAPPLSGLISGVPLSWKGWSWRTAQVGTSAFARLQPLGPPSSSTGAR